MRVTGKVSLAVGHVTAFEHQFGAVGKRVLDGVAVEVLIDAVDLRSGLRGLAIMPAAVTLGGDRKGVLHPAAYIDIVDQEIAEQTTAGPQEGVELANLISQFAHPGRCW